MGSLVAKTTDQCEVPCFQTAAPLLKKGCNEDADCIDGYYCKGMQCVPKEGFAEDARMKGWVGVGGSRSFSYAHRENFDSRRGYSNVPVQLNSRRM